MAVKLLTLSRLGAYYLLNALALTMKVWKHILHMKAAASFLALSEEALYVENRGGMGGGGARKGEMRNQSATIQDGLPAHHKINLLFFFTSFDHFFWLRSRACCDFWALEPFPISVL